MKTMSTAARAVALALSAALSASAAHAEEKVRVAFIRTVTLLPFYYAQQGGYFKAEGLEVELIPVQTGPAAAAALASGTADIGYAAVTPIIIARDRAQPYRFIMGLEWERTPDTYLATILASQRSGVKSMKDLPGKTILAGPPGGLCELAWRDWLAKSNIAWDQVKVLTAPFPQHQAALEVGNADAACTFEPFASSIKASKVNPVVLGQGYLAGEKRRYYVDGLFATEAWIKTNPKAIASFKAALTKALANIGKDTAAVRKILTDEFKLSGAMADSMTYNFDPARPFNPTDLLPIVEALKRYGMIKPTFDAADVVADIK